MCRAETAITDRIRNFDWHFEDPVCDLNNTYALLYFFLADTYIQTFGERGDQCVAQAMEDYGYFRGALLRARHMAMGMEINLNTMKKYYDLPGDCRCSAKYFVRTDQGYYQECYRCQFADVWKILEGVPDDGASHVASFYCNCFKGAMWRGYCDGLNIIIDQAIGRGDPLCNFFTYLDRDADRTSPSPAAFAWDAMDWDFETPANALNNIYAMIYFSLAKTALEMFGQDGEAAVRNGLRRFGRFQGALLAWRDQQEGLTPTEERFSAHNHAPEALLSQIWNVLEKTPDGEESKVGTLYFQEVGPAMLEGYLA